MLTKIITCDAPNCEETCTPSDGNIPATGWIHIEGRRVPGPLHIIDVCSKAHLGPAINAVIAS